jgi:hypothetical protein
MPLAWATADMFTYATVLAAFGGSEMEKLACGLYSLHK